MSDKKSLINIDPFPESTKESLFNPTANALGKGVGGIASFVSIPFRNLGVWSENIISQYEGKIIERNLLIPEKNRDISKLNVAYKAIDDSKLNIKEENLQDMFANLISSALDDRKNNLIQPSFSGILKEMSSEDAELLQLLKYNPNIPLVKMKLAKLNSDSFIDLPELILIPFEYKIYEDASILLYSLRRNGLVEMDFNGELESQDNQTLYKLAYKTGIYNQYKLNPPNKDFTEVVFEHGRLVLTSFGKQLIDIVIT